MWLDKEVENNTDFPSKYSKNVLSIKKHHPNYEYTLWNRKMISDLFYRYPELQRWKYFYYNKLQYFIETCDMARYMILYIYGGIYVDLDFSCFQSFDIINLEQPIIWCDDIPASWDILVPKIKSRIFNGWLGSQPRHPFWPFMLDYIVSNYDREVIDVLATTGPIALGRAAKIYGIYDMYKVDRCHIFQNQCGWFVMPVDSPECKDKMKILSNEWVEGSKWQADVVSNRVRKNICIIIILFIILIVYYYNKK